MGNNDLAVLSLVAKQVADLKVGFVNLSKQPGPRGDTGPNGAIGNTGKAGAPGSKGADGPKAKDGAAGKSGKDGADGTDGADGAVGKAPAHEWQGTKLRFKLPTGRWGKFVDLKGSPGSVGYVIANSQQAAIINEPLDSVFVYNQSGTQLDRINYQDGSYKAFTYATGRLVQLDHVTGGLIMRKAFTYAGETLVSIDESRL